MHRCPQVLNPKSPGAEVELLVELGVIWYVHLAVLAEVAAVSIYHRRGVVIEPLGTLLKQRRDNHDTQLGGHC